MKRTLTFFNEKILTYLIPPIVLVAVGLFLVFLFRLMSIKKQLEPLNEGLNRMGSDLETIEKDLNTIQTVNEKWSALDLKLIAGLLFLKAVRKDYRHSAKKSWLRSAARVGKTRIRNS